MSDGTHLHEELPTTIADDLRIAVTADDIGTVLKALADEAAVEFEAHDSNFFGAYWTDLPQRMTRIMLNRDPLFQPGVDPPDDSYFEAAYRDFSVLIDIEAESRLRSQGPQIIMRRFPGSRIVFGAQV